MAGVIALVLYGLLQGAENIKAAVNTYYGKLKEGTDKFLDEKKSKLTSMFKKDK